MVRRGKGRLEDCISEARGAGCWAQGGDNRIAMTGLEVCAEQGGSDECQFPEHCQRPLNSAFLERTLPLP